MSTCGHGYLALEDTSNGNGKTGDSRDSGVPWSNFLIPCSQNCTKGYLVWSHVIYTTLQRLIGLSMVWFFANQHCKLRYSPLVGSQTSSFNSVKQLCKRPNGAVGELFQFL